MRPSRGGFTLIELMVCLGVIALLAMFVLPAVQSAREAARRLECANHLKQIGLALNSYEATHRRYPPDNLPDRVAGTELSGLTRLLPYIEQSDIFNCINFDLWRHDSRSAPLSANRTARLHRVETYLCPSDGAVRRRNSYRFNTGRLNPAMGTPLYDGPFHIGPGPTPELIKDGLSRTVFLSERSGGSFIPGAKDTRRDSVCVTLNGVVFESDIFYSRRCNTLTPDAWYVTNGRYWFYNGTRNTGYNHNGLPNDRRPSCVGDNFETPRRSPPGSSLV